MSETIEVPENNSENEKKVLPDLLREKGLCPEFFETAELWKRKREAEIRTEFPGIPEGIDPIQLIDEQAKIFAEAGDKEGAIEFYYDILRRMEDSTRDPVLTEDFIHLTWDRIEALEGK